LRATRFRRLLKITESSSSRLPAGALSFLLP
jgi:hypothetical protein